MATDSGVPTHEPPPSPGGPRPDGTATGALVFGLSGLFFCLFTASEYVGIALGVFGIVLANRAISRMRGTRTNSRALAVAGLVAAVGAVTAGGFLTAMDAGFRTPVAGSAGSVTAPSTSPLPPPSASWGQRFTWPSGLAVEVGRPGPFTPGPSTYWGSPVRNVALVVTVFNGTPAPYTYNWAAFGPMKVLFNGMPINLIFDELQKVGGAPVTVIMPGQSLATNWAFPVDAVPGELRMQFVERFGGPPAIFAGLA